ncbi:MAG: LysM peptidoglycan-binding domain-containing protein [Bacteroidales bacterium]|nr:LysM peptidoglycan-binding domain-containing protein [Bacteroidales bacterium]MCF8388484.1 LysM peptidoglycan-binding domain-containing protein [Bacteroidales bacterium]MCF8397072.1 LysM peptidoglycan-binding domain-containing protein [Bacteroidales bacterium]
MKKLLTTAIICCLFYTIASAQNDSLNKSNDFAEDSQIAVMLDSLVHLTYFGDYKFISDTNLLNKYAFKKDEVPRYSDSIYETRINELNNQTTIELTYNNTIKSFIELYAIKKRELTSKMLGLSEIYFPMFEEQLDRFDMPLELKYLAIVESALNPRAGSRAGAKGIWQFMYGTGKVYNLNVTTLIDERYDPLKSTIAACEHLQDLYDIYGNWSLAMAAYNSGAGNVNKAIRRAGHVKNYWSVWPYLPRETRGYVPAFTAVVYVMNYAPEHNLYPIEPGIFFHEIDTVAVKQPLAFDQISEFLGISPEVVRFLNPMYKKEIIPAYDGKTYPLRLPNKHIGDFINNEMALYNYKSTSGQEREKILAQIEQANSRQIHVVRYGENLGLIAQRYHCYISQLKRWNNLRGNTIYPGQKLVIYSPFNEGYSSRGKSVPVKRSGEKSYHTVNYGENLGLIAKKYKCSVTDLKEWNNLRSSVIHPKQKLIVYKPESTPELEKGQKYLYYTVRQGDTLWDIAKMYDGVTVDQIKRLNNISNTRRLKPGQKIKIAVNG